MIPPPPPEAIHLSFEPGPYRMAMGLIALPETEMIELDDRYVDEMAQRRTLLGEQRHEVFHAVPGSEPARQAVLDRLAAYLPERFPAWFAREGTQPAQPPDRRDLGPRGVARRSADRCGPAGAGRPLHRRAGCTTAPSC